MKVAQTLTSAIPVLKATSPTEVCVNNASKDVKSAIKSTPASKGSAESVMDIFNLDHRENA